jgi:hypothetical protein
MAASELLENAVKYASRDDTHIVIKVSPATEQIKILVVNTAKQESINTLLSIYEKISEGDPLQVYVTQMKEAAVRSDGKSHLGLARIRYETGGDLNVTVEKNEVQVSIAIG